ncbi:hypothetical protein KGQ20_37025 [Catenulispora sp. NF23]|uniref:hypothetical protein n=1 Tax=Catenulispora pinistramenti TaxID=2705254 RepID=UPI001BA5B57F|nr:hypothetical protein [Catenulispora pinistramenti]MBS2538369.1 hypothetical protein [Catenulispora pinistramenti]
MSALNWAVVAGTDEPARAEWTRAALEARESGEPGESGVAEPRFVAWSAVLSSEAEFRAGELVFVERLYPRNAENPVGGHRARYEELRVALRQLEAAVTKAGATLAVAVEPMLLALDRRRLDAFLRLNGFPVLESDDSLTDDGILRPRFAGSDEWLIDGSWTHLFLHRTRTGHEVRHGPGRRVPGARESADLTGLLADDGIHTVASLLRVYLSGTHYDIRFAVLDGKATHAAGVIRGQAVAREWYGGRRRELEAFLERFGDERWQRLVSLAERTAAHFPGIRSLGVDLAVDNHESEFVFGVDPFGAFLPGLVSGLPNPTDDRRSLSVRAAVLRSPASRS